MGYENLYRQEDYLQSRADEYIWLRARGLGISRRRFFQLLAAGGVAAATPDGRHNAMVDHPLEVR